MSFSKEDKMIIKHYCLDKHGVKRLLKKFPNKGWAKGGLRHLLRKIDKTGDFARIPGSGRTPTALTNENVEEVKVILIISVGVSKLGRTSVFFLEPGVKINGQYYRNELLARMLPEMNNISRVDYIFLQDGARSHTAKTTLEYLNEKCPAYVKPNYWPPNSPDLNVLDFIIWGDFEKKVWKNKPHDVESLKQAIIKEWRIYSQEIIDNAIDSFRKRLRQITNADGGYIEHYKR